ncbi:MAG: HEAT repeat domain-containing protein, partial [Planctomycetes bacterium]|nr:HEAT repeat domain-containing protein [Planctomycetota bacterium]
MQIALLLTLLAPLILPQGDPAKDMKSKDYSVRLAAVQNLAVVEHAQAEKLLVAALKDKDWEVVEAAASALGKVGG